MESIEYKAMNKQCKTCSCKDGLEKNCRNSGDCACHIELKDLTAIGLGVTWPGTGDFEFYPSKVVDGQGNAVNAECLICGICSFPHKHEKGKNPKDFVRIEEMPELAKKSLSCHHEWKLEKFMLGEVKFCPKCEQMESLEKKTPWALCGFCNTRVNIGPNGESGHVCWPYQNYIPKTRPETRPPFHNGLPLCPKCNEYACQCPVKNPFKTKNEARKFFGLSSKDAANGVLSTCREFTQGLRVFPCCASCPACKCHEVQVRGEELSNDKPKLVNGNEPRIDSQPQCFHSKDPDTINSVNVCENCDPSRICDCVKPEMLMMKMEKLKWKCDGENGCGYDGSQEDRQSICGGPVAMKGLQLHQMIRVRNLAIQEAIELLKTY